MVDVYGKLALHRIAFMPRELLLVHECLLEVGFNAKVDFMIHVRAIL